MIKDKHALARLDREWQGVRLSQSRVRVNVGSAFGHISHAFIDLCYSLILIYAYGVLADVLVQLRDERVFSCADSGLGRLMRSSRNVLPWGDFQLVDAGRVRRNQVAHDGQALPRGETWDYIDAIERELVGWNIIPDPQPDYTKPYGTR